MLIFVNHDDLRALELMEIFISRGYYVSDQIQDMKYADIIYLGMKGIDYQNRLLMNKETIVLQEDFFKDLKKGCTLYTLVFNKHLDELSQKYNFHYFSLLNDDDFIRKNSILTAEGCLSYLISHRRYPIYHSRILVLGYGHCAKPIIRYLKAMGALVSVAVRRKELKDEIEKQNCHYMDIHQVSLVEQDIVINTIPEIVIKEEQLLQAKKNVMIIDLASYPYGVDHHYALSIGLNSIILPSIPCKYAYGYAGQMIADIIERNQKNE